MDIEKLLKSSMTEIGAFAKRNSKRFAIIADLKTAKDGCKTKEAKNIILAAMAPMERELKKECDAFNAKLASIWKQAKGEKVPDVMQKKLDAALKNGANTIKSRSGHDLKYDSRTDNHNNWVFMESFSGP